MQHGKQQPNQRRIYLITHPRVASNLLVKILNLPKQNVQETFQGGYFFKDPLWKSLDLKVDRRHISDWSGEETTILKDLYQKSFDDFQQWLATSETQDSVAFVKEHAIFMGDPVAKAEYASRLYKGVSDQDNSLEPHHHALPPHWTVQAPYGKQLKQLPSPLNKTVLPDEFLLTFRPTFLIRHPALAFPSYVRAVTGPHEKPTDKDEEALAIREQEIFMTFHWMRSLFDFYAQHSGLCSQRARQSASGLSGESGTQEVTWPIVLEADDVINSPATVVRYAELVGLDASKLKWDWASIADEELHKMPPGRKRLFASTIVNSTGVIKGKSAEGLKIDVEAKKWRVEFGELYGTQMEKWVRAAMPDYLFLKERRLRPESAMKCG